MEILAKIWSGMIIDGHPVLAEFIREDADQEIIKKSEEWKSKHVRESQNVLHIVQCKNSKCSSLFRLSYLQVSSSANFSYTHHNQWLKVDEARCRCTLLFLDSKSSFESSTWCYRSEEFSKGHTLRLQLSCCSKHNGEAIVF